jgi:predicted DNA-binding transcriptional regulator AlpA
MARRKASDKVPRPPNTFPNEVAWELLGISRRTFYRKLKDGEITPPVERAGTKRLWWTEADIEIAKEELKGMRSEERE